jgi:hypothetical protein
MKANDLTLAQINQIVAEMEDVPVVECIGRLHYRNRANDMCEFSPVTLWHLGGPIIEREHILLDYRQDQWFAFTDRLQYENGLQDYRGRTCLEAAMRCYATRYLPDEADVAED